MSHQNNSRQHHRLTCHHYTQEANQHPDGFVVNDIIANSPNGRIDDITEHTQVRNQQERREPPPGKIQVRERVDSKQEQGSLF